MSLERLSVSRAFALTLKSVDGTVRGKVYRVAEELAAEHPNLPGPRDFTVDLPPVGTLWARPVPGTIWSVLYAVGPDKVFVRSVNVLTRP